MRRFQFAVGIALLVLTSWGCRTTETQSTQTKDVSVISNQRASNFALYKMDGGNVQYYSCPKMAWKRSGNSQVNTLKCRLKATKPADKFVTSLKSMAAQASGGRLNFGQKMVIRRLVKAVKSADNFAKELDSMRENSFTAKVLSMFPLAMGDDGISTDPSVCTRDINEYGNPSRCSCPAGGTYNPQSGNCEETMLPSRCTRDFNPWGHPSQCDCPAGYSYNGMTGSCAEEGNQVDCSNRPEEPGFCCAAETASCISCRRESARRAEVLRNWEQQCGGGAEIDCNVRPPEPVMCCMAATPGCNACNRRSAEMAETLERWKAQCETEEGVPCDREILLACEPPFFDGCIDGQTDVHRCVRNSGGGLDDDLIGCDREILLACEPPMVDGCTTGDTTTHRCVRPGGNDGISCDREIALVCEPPMIDGCITGQTSVHECVEPEQRICTAEFAEMFDPTTGRCFGASNGCEIADAIDRGARRARPGDCGNNEDDNRICTAEFAIMINPETNECFPASNGCMIAEAIAAGARRAAEGECRRDLPERPRLCLQVVSRMFDPRTGQCFTANNSCAAEAAIANGARRARSGDCE